ncbi:AAA family ATPase [Mollicutes bacterium LVI A0078]|nr:AAA family ATPase [Mollicutes bacterium LVI A0075]WOO90822.1 AAA family ATPase [Mollicutes bacterium LVI A0078]
MRIKQLKLSGFKSFANKTVINFDENFIGVVGPNGSGKSNVIDAIRWVFGEKSNKSLRGNSSSDVIFGGTEKRKKQNIAEVTIVLDNTDRHLELEFDEVAFTRRLYRSGKSEYLINGVEARYKDIQELILDKGIGKNAFSIISQGKIEEIITTSPENRRLIVEEVAGILKYKKRKESALNKLSKTEDNLEQVSLILNEIEERRIPLERQAQIAEKFLVYKEQLETKEVELLATRIKKSEEEYHGLKVITDNAKLELIKLETTETNLELDEEELKAKINEQSVKLNQLNIQVNDCLQKLSSKRTDLKVLKERQALLSERDGREFELDNNITRLREELHAVKQEYTQLESYMKLAATKEQEYQDGLTKLRSELGTVRIRENDIKSELNKVTIPFATRKLLEANLSGVHGTVSDNFKVDLKYTEAISTIIGGRMYDVITDDRNSATKAINYLKKNRFGRQTLLPRDAMRPMKIDDATKAKLQNAKGFVGIGIDLVRFEQVNQNVFSNLLGNVIVCSTLEEAKQIASNVTNRFRIVTLEGDLIQTSGAMSGGRSKRQSKLVLESNLAKVKNERIKLDAKFETLNEKHEQARQEYVSRKTEYQLSKSLLDRLESDINLNKMELQELGVDQTTDSGSNELEVAIHELEAKADSLNVTRTKLELEKNKNSERAEEVFSQLRSLREEIREINSGHSNDNVRLERLAISLKTDTAVLREDYNMSTAMAIEKANDDINIDEYATEVKSLKSKIRNLGPVNTLAIAEYKELTERFEFIDTQREDLVVAKNKLEDIIRKLDEFFITAFDKTYSKLRVEFQHVYKELFGGGHADLILTNEDDLLLSGVEIVAQPPGKKLQTISLLSGGEKALTAIALLFAILRIRSLPFAILDEVEAALDEANVKRYAQYIKVFSERTQFIVITHRQGTMEMVDALYGVTMQEKGVSTTVKVSLKEGASYA